VGTVVVMHSVLEDLGMPDADVDGDVALAAADALLARTWATVHGGPLPERVVAARTLAAKAHEGQHRRSGEPYLSHPLTVAAVVTALGLDEHAVAAAICHDVVEDCGVSLDELTAACGPEVAAIVDGVTKIDRLRFDTEADAQAATLRKMLVAIAGDIRVLLVKLADRAHNVATLAALPPEKRERIAAETLDIYAPLAHRLGVSELKRHLEDHAFAHRYPDQHAEVARLVADRAPAREARLAEATAALTAALAEHGVDAEVSGRTKHLWSIYRKIVRTGRSIDEINDLVGVRVVVDSVRDCYAALGVVHSLWTPVPGRFKDMIAMPRFNLYQSLHATVLGPDGRPLDVQIRTAEMHRRAEVGVAAHFLYKEGEAAPSARDLAWFQRLVDWHDDAADSGQFIDRVRFDLAGDEVFVFTPRGKVVALPEGATPVDFAYAIHTEVGHRCMGAKVNDVLVPLRTVLRSGDRVEVLTRSIPQPSRDWLQFVATGHARRSVRAWFARQRRDDEIAAGRELLVKALRTDGLPAAKLLDSPELDAVAATLRLSGHQDLYRAVGDGHVAARDVVARVRAARDGIEPVAPVRHSRPRRAVRAEAATELDGTVAVDGLSGVEVRMAQCCNPVPGDAIGGYVTIGHGVTVHRADCANFARRADSGRRVAVDWSSGSGPAHVVVDVVALNRARLLRDVAEVFAAHGVNLTATNTMSPGEAEVRQRFEFDLAEPGHLDAILEAVAAVESVFDVVRVR
jgi:GTP diphosphokinase / guanosine-3',5'-bis(diphosphate) 3'-diphosphatase